MLFSIPLLDTPWAYSLEYCMMILWGGLEALLSPSPNEIRHQIAAYAAAFLEPPGTARLKRYQATKKLYDRRSAVVHGRETKSREPLREAARSSYELLAEVLAECLERGGLPDFPTLQEEIFSPSV